MQVRWFFLLVFIGLNVHAEMIDTYQFYNAENRVRAMALAKSLRCPQCQNQNLIESNSPIAYDLRLEVYKMVDSGKTDQQIIQQMTARFGDFVSYKPPFQWTTALLWLSPITLLLVAIALMCRYLRQQQKVPIQSALNQIQQETLQQLLNSRDKL